MSSQTITTAGLIDHLAHLSQTKPRVIVALAGSPASGKSTLAETLASGLSRRGCAAQVMPMDGFHLDNRILEEKGLLPRKGAPETFDLGGFARTVASLHLGRDVVVPVFDRDRDIAIAGAQMIAADIPVVIVDGNYLLFDAPGWRDLQAHWDVAVQLKTPLDVLEERLIARWLDQGLSEQVARDKAEGNDLPNARRVEAHALTPDFILKSA